MGEPSSMLLMKELPLVFGQHPEIRTGKSGTSACSAGTDVWEETVIGLPT